MALIIPFKKKESEQNSVEKLDSQDNSDDSPEPESDGLTTKDNRKIRIIAQNGQRIISINKFKFQKDSEIKGLTENQKLREGLVIKIHKYRQELLKEYQPNPFLSFDELEEELLDICADYADSILDSKESALSLLNQYNEFKKVIDFKLSYLIDNSSIV